MKLNLNQFLAEQNLTKKSLAEQIGWTANSLSQALRNEGKSSTFLLKFTESSAFPDWLIGYDFESGEYYFTKDVPESSEPVGGINFFRLSKEFLLKGSGRLHQAPNIYSFIAACKENEFEVYENGSHIWFSSVQGKELGGFPVEDLPALMSYFKITTKIKEL